MHSSYLVNRLSKDEEVGLTGRQNCAREASEGLWGPWESPTGQSPPGTRASTGPRPKAIFLPSGGWGGRVRRCSQPRGQNKILVHSCENVAGNFKAEVISYSRNQVTQLLYPAENQTRGRFLARIEPARDRPLPPTRGTFFTQPSLYHSAGYGIISGPSMKLWFCKKSKQKTNG